MRKGKSESHREEQLKPPLKLVQLQEKEEGTKDAAKIDNGCCEPACSPITCE